MKTRIIFRFSLVSHDMIFCRSITYIIAADDLFLLTVYCKLTRFDTVAILQNIIIQLVPNCIRTICLYIKAK